VGGDECNGFPSVCRFADDLDARLLAKQASEALARKGLVVDDQDPQRRHDACRRKAAAGTAAADAGAAGRLTPSSLRSGPIGGAVNVAGGPSSVSNGITTDATVPPPAASESPNCCRVGPYR
jgi:hypothetical protein